MSKLEEFRDRYKAGGGARMTEELHALTIESFPVDLLLCEMITEEDFLEFQARFKKYKQ